MFTKGIFFFNLIKVFVYYINQYYYRFMFEIYMNKFQDSIKTKLNFQY